ncbi:MAG: LamG domain-containing protein [Nanoarchaeota archaeon]|nr:LamG domain-containing protein [Nanoarchaeota archaeon]MBU1876148.1 LamG domain-containing protein [Nanoarchaeota archaeon]
MNKKKTAGNNSKNIIKKIILSFSLIFLVTGLFLSLHFAGKGGITGASVVDSNDEESFFTSFFRGIISFFTGQEEVSVSGSPENQPISISAAPSIDAIILNSTDPFTNNTNQNLTAYATTSDGDNDSVKVIYDWKKDGTSIAVLNMPFEGINGTTTNNAWDYSGYGNNGSETGATWNATGGYDGKGAYEFDGDSDAITISDTDYLDFNTTTDLFTISFWAKHNCPNHQQCTGSLYDAMISKGISCDDNYIFYMGGNAIPVFAVYNGSGCGGATIIQGSAWKNNTWVFVTGQYNGTHIVYYENGVKYGSTAMTKVLYANAQPIRIGGSSTALNSWNGSIDDVMIFNRTLSAEQILALYNNKTDLIVSQETGNKREVWNVTATPNDGTSDGTPLTSNILTIGNSAPTVSSVVLNTTDPSTNNTNTNLTAYATTSDTDGNPVKVIYNWMKNGTSIAVLNMPFEGINGTTTNNAWDYSGYGNNGLETGATWNATGGYDGKGAYQFDGIDDYISFTATLERSPTVSQFAWIYLKGNCPTDRCEIIANNWPDTGNLLEVVSNSLYVYGYKWNTPAWISGGTINYNQWYHVGFTYNKVNSSTGNITLYVNGAVVYSEQSTARNGTMSPMGTINIGSLNDGGREWNGTIDDVMIFNHTLSAQQILALYQNRTNLIVSQETGNKGEVWNVTVTPNDGTSDGTALTSNSVTITAANKTASINITSPTEGQTFPRGKDTSGEDIYTSISNNIEIQADVYDGNSQGINNVNCSFYKNDSLLGTNLTNSSGTCLYSYDKSNDNPGSYVLKVNITSLPAGYNRHSNNSESNVTIQLIKYLTTLSTNNLRSNGRYIFGDAAVLHINITKDGVLYDPTAITVYAKDTSQNIEDIHSYPGDITKVSTGQYYSFTYINSSYDLVHWDVYANDSSSYITAAIHGDVILDSSTATLNFTAKDESGDFISGTSIIVYDRNGYLTNTFSAATSKASALNDLYELLYSTTSRGSLRIRNLNLSKASLSVEPQMVQSYAGAKPSNYPRMSSVIALNDSLFNFTNATLTIPRGDVDNIQKICHCTSWNFASGVCNSAGDWECNSTSDYSDFTSNSTHISFTVTDFTGYGAAGYNANLTINDSAEGSSVTTDTAVEFYAHYVNATSGVAITDSLGECNITIPDASVTNDNMSYDSGDARWEYNLAAGFSSAGTKSWSVNCTSTTYDDLNASDDLSVTSAGGAVPEFEDYAILFILITVVGGFLMMKKRS